MNKWRQKARRWRRAYLGTDKTIANLVEQINGMSEHEAAALNEVEELRRDCVKLATELARVQGVREDEILGYEETASECHALRARLTALQESDMLDLLEKKRLLAWQVRVRDAWAHYKKAHLSEKWTAPVEDLRRAIEGEVEPKEET
jgi:hypothetical protein